MLIVIHNLPPNTRFGDVKQMLYEKCGLRDLILDKLVPEDNGMKITVGLASEEDAAILVRKINGLYMKGHQLYVQDMRQKESDQPYRLPMPSGNLGSNQSQKWGSHSSQNWENNPQHNWGNNQNWNNPGQGKSNDFQRPDLQKYQGYGQDLAAAASLWAQQSLANQAASYAQNVQSPMLSQGYGQWGGSGQGQNMAVQQSGSTFGHPTTSWGECEVSEPRGRSQDDRSYGDSRRGRNDRSFEEDNRSKAQDFGPRNERFDQPKPGNKRRWDVAQPDDWRQKPASPPREFRQHHRGRQDNFPPESNLELNQPSPWGNRPNFDYSKDQFHDSKSNYDAPSTRFSEQNQTFDRSNSRFEAPQQQQKWLEGSKSTFDGPNPRFDGPKPRFDDPNPRFDGPKSRFDDPNPRFDGPKSRFDDPNPRFDGPKSRFDDPNPRFDGPKQRYDDPNPRLDVLKPRFDAPNPKFDGPISKFDEPNPRYAAPKSRLDNSTPRFDAPVSRFSGGGVSGPRHSGPKPRFGGPNLRFDSPNSNFGGNKPRFDGPKSSNPRFEGPKGFSPRYDRPTGSKPRFDGPKPKFEPRFKNEKSKFNNLNSNDKNDPMSDEKILNRVRRKHEYNKRRTAKMITEDIYANMGLNDESLRSYFMDPIIKRLDKLIGGDVLQSFNIMYSKFIDTYNRSEDYKIFEEAKKLKRDDFRPGDVQEAGSSKQGGGAGGQPTKKFKSELPSMHTRSGLPKPKKAPKPVPKPVLRTATGKIPTYVGGNKNIYKVQKQKHLKDMEKLTIPDPGPAYRDIVDQELDAITKLLRSEAEKVEDQRQREFYLTKTTDECLLEFKKILKQVVCQRITNEGLKLVRIYGTGRPPKKQDLEPFLRQFGVLALKKSDRKPYFIAHVDTYETLDKLCGMGVVLLGDREIVCKPMHLTPKVKRVDMYSIKRMRNKYVESQKEMPEFSLLEKDWEEKMAAWMEKQQKKKEEKAKQQAARLEEEAKRKEELRIKKEQEKAPNEVEAIENESEKQPEITVHTNAYGELHASFSVIDEVHSDTDDVKNKDFTSDDIIGEPIEDNTPSKSDQSILQEEPNVKDSEIIFDDEDGLEGEGDEGNDNGDEEENDDEAGEQNDFAEDIDLDNIDENDLEDYS